MIAQKTNRSAYMKRFMVYISPSMNPIETNGWVFASAANNAWAAVKVVGGYSWGPTSAGRWPGSIFLIPAKEYAPVVFFAGSPQDGFPTYDAFQNYVLNQLTVQENSDSIVIQRPDKPDLQFFTDYRAPVVNDPYPDDPYNANPPLKTAYTYNSPYLKTGDNRYQVIAQWGETRRIYDFENITIKETK